MRVNVKIRVRVRVRARVLPFMTAGYLDPKSHVNHKQVLRGLRDRVKDRVYG